MAKESRRHRHGEQGGTRGETESLMHGSAGGRRKSAPHGVTRRRPTLHSIAREYVDEAESGRVADRPQFREMIDPILGQ